MNLKCNSSAATSNGSAETTWADEFESAASHYIIPLLLALGLICQTLNLCTLHGRRISSLSYTLYFKTLSVNYIVGIVFLLINLLPMYWLVNDHYYWVVFYYAHLNHYCINLFLFAGNMIIATLAAEPLRAILRPLDALRWSPRHALHVLLLLYLITGVTLIPVTLIKTVHGPDAQGVYCIRTLRSGLLNIVRFAITPAFELFIALAIVIIYICLLVTYYGVRSRHRQLTGNVRNTSQHSTQRVNEGTNRKAVLICIASVTAYIISNIPSALKEVVYLWEHLIHQVGWLHTPVGQSLRIVTNICLLSNFWLIVLLQFAISRQYRSQIKNVLTVCKKDIGSNVNSATFSPHATSFRTHGHQVVHTAQKPRTHKDSDGSTHL